LDVGEDAVFFDNPDLPETRSEVALPLRARGDIIGVLDVQSEEPEAFSEEDVRALQAIADQVAVAVSNARLFRQVEETLDAERRARGELAREAWADLVRTESRLGFQSDERGTLPAEDVWDPEMVSAVRTGQAAFARDGEAALAVPVKARGQVIGVIDAHLPSGTDGWTPEQQELLETLAQQLGVALESAQLYREAQMLARRERLTAEITDRMRSATDLDELLQTAIRETAAVLGASRAFVQWVPSEE
jgi:GAF domain-containing protein